MDQKRPVVELHHHQSLVNGRNGPSKLIVIQMTIFFSVCDMRWEAQICRQKK
jgi:hypothetical protein